MTSVDSTASKAHKSAGRGGRATKTHAILDHADGRSLAVCFTGAGGHDGPAAQGLLSGAALGGAFLNADRAYVSKSIRDAAAEAGGALNAPPKSITVMERNFESVLYRERSRVERFFNRIKEFRRFAARYDKLLDTFAMFTHLAIIAVCGVRIRV